MRAARRISARVSRRRARTTRGREPRPTSPMVNGPAQTCKEFSRQCPASSPGTARRSTCWGGETGGAGREHPPMPYSAARARLAARSAGFPPILDFFAPPSELPRSAGFPGRSRLGARFGTTVLEPVTKPLWTAGFPGRRRRCAGFCETLDEIDGCSGFEKRTVDRYDGNASAAGAVQVARIDASVGRDVRQGT